MKYVIGISLMCISLFVASCHRHSVVNGISCYAKALPVTDASASHAIPGDASIYQLPGTWRNQFDRPVSLDQLKGKVQVVAMVFTHCGYACPRIVEDIKAIEDSLPRSERGNVGYVLVSFDSRRDNPARLGQFAAGHELDDHWQLLHGEPGQVRELSMLLNVKYQETTGGNFNHSNVICILDKEGVIRQSIEGLDPQTATAINIIKDLVRR